jgi:hypothetical protein
MQTQCNLLNLSKMNDLLPSWYIKLFLCVSLILVVSILAYAFILHPISVAPLAHGCNPICASHVSLTALG